MQHLQNLARIRDLNDFQVIKEFEDLYYTSVFSPSSRNILNTKLQKAYKNYHPNQQTPIVQSRLQTTQSFPRTEIALFNKNSDFENSNNEASSTSNLIDSIKPIRNNHSNMTLVQKFDPKSSLSGMIQFYGGFMFDLRFSNSNYIF